MKSHFFPTDRRGFTLIELMVAISILVIVSAVGLVGYSQAQIAARDAKRKADLHNITIALELYHQKNGRYPPTNSATNGSGPTNGLCPSWSGPSVENDCWNNLLPGFLDSMPLDPQNTQSPLRMYAYKTRDELGCPPEGQWYELMTLLENTNDSSRIEAKDVTWCDGTSLQTPAIVGNPVRKQILFIIQRN